MHDKRSPWVSINEGYWYCMTVPTAWDCSLWMKTFTCSAFIAFYTESFLKKNRLSVLQILIFSVEVIEEGVAARLFSIDNPFFRVKHHRFMSTQKFENEIVPPIWNPMFLLFTIEEDGAFLMMTRYVVRF